MKPTSSRTNALAVVFALVMSTASAEFSLSERCPPSFRLSESNTCELQSLYFMYGSIQNQGIGGTQTNLPHFNDGYTPQQIDLGRYLFFDPILSVDGSMSCASCHQPDRGFSDGQSRSIGLNGQTLQRSAPSLWNVGFSQRLFWDARSTRLEAQALEPLFHENEMGNTPQQLLQTLKHNANYRALFRTAFPASSDITVDDLAIALSAFQSSLISLNSRYDAYAHGDHSALSEQEIQGLNVFRSFVARCSECHTPPLFSNNQIAVIGVAERTGETLDVGAERTFNSRKLRGGFKVPNLRNITLTAPYMHAGQKQTLEEVVEFYSRGRGNELDDSDERQLHWHITQPDLTTDEIAAVVAFLGALTDETMKPITPSTVPSGLPLVHDNLGSDRP